jgi:thioredoxin 1
MADNIKNVSEKDFKANVLDAALPVLVDFGAMWCGPCKMIEPLVVELAGEYKDRMDFAKVNVDEAPKVASSYNVMSLPTLIVFKGGKPLEQVVGYRPKKDIQKLIDKALAQ